MTNGPGTSPPAVSAYVAAVRDELSDLPPAQTADILDDVREHITQVAQEYGDDVRLAELIDRLGSPSAYVAELRAAAGIAPPAPQPQRAGFGRRLLRLLAAVFGTATAGFTVVTVADVVFSLSGAPAFFGVPAAVCFVVGGASVLFLVLRHEDPAGELRQIPGACWLGERVQQLRATSWGPGVIDFAASLQPAWWLARAAILGALVASVSSAALGTFVFVVAAVASVYLGRAAARGQMPGRRAIAIYGLNAAIVAGGVFGVLAIAQSPHDGYVDPIDQVATDGLAYSHGAGSIATDAGVPVTNIFAYAADGALIDQVRLYDQDGRPLVLADTEPCYEEAPDGTTFVIANPWGTNVYPRFVAEAHMSGSCVPAPPEPPYGAQLPTSADADDADAGAPPAGQRTGQPTGEPRPAPSGGTSAPGK